MIHPCYCLRCEYGSDQGNSITLVHGGTPAVAVELHESKFMPLMDKENFKRWRATSFVSENIDDEFDELSQELYEGTNALPRYAADILLSTR